MIRTMVSAAIVTAALLVVPAGAAGAVATGTTGSQSTTAPTSTAWPCAPVDVESAAVVADPATKAPTLVVKGTSPVGPVSVQLAPTVQMFPTSTVPESRSYVVIGCSPGYARPVPTPFSASYDISRTGGTVTVTVIGATRTWIIPVSPASDPVPSSPLPSGWTCSLIKFTSASVSGSPASRSRVLTVSGVYPAGIVAIGLVPQTLIPRPAYQPVQVVGCAPSMNLPLVVNYSVSLEVGAIRGAKGVEVIGAGSSQQIPVP